VLRAIHLLFNEGYWSSTDDVPIRPDLCRLALGLARSLSETFPGDPEVAGLLALLSFHDARRGARHDAHDQPIPLSDQDRTLWEQDGIRAATELLERALTLGPSGPFVTEAAIAAVHCRAPTAEATEWSEIASLYAILESLRPIPAVRVNRAFAVARSSAPAAGLALLERRDIDADAYPYVHLVRGTLLAETGETAAAEGAFDQAECCARNEAERAQIRQRRARLRAGKGGA
jgi:RNA polymerase sigma-70 factor (ECF subfamily)